MIQQLHRDFGIGVVATPAVCLAALDHSSVSQQQFAMENPPFPPAVVKYSMLLDSYQFGQNVSSLTSNDR